MTALAFRRSAFSVITVFCVLIGFEDRLISKALVLGENFSGNIVQDLQVNLRADDVWAVYRRLDFYKLLLQLSPGVFRTIDYLGGHGEVGTLVNFTLQPELATSYWLDQIIDIDEKERSRVLQHVRGSFRDAGFTLVKSVYKIVKKEQSSCVIRATMSFEIRQESLSNSSVVRPSWWPATNIVDYINSIQLTPQGNISQDFSGEIVSEMKVNLPASEIWNVFKSKDFGHLLLKLLPGYYKQVDYVNNNSSVRTIFNITLQPAFGSLNWLEKVIEIDDKTKTRFSQHIQGQFLDSSFTEFTSGYRIINLANNKSCVIRAFMPFKIKLESLPNASTLQLNWDTAMIMAKYVSSLKIQAKD